MKPMNNNMDWKTFVIKCVETYRPIGFFQADFFNDGPALFEKMVFEIDNVGVEFFLDDEILNSDLGHVYGVLLSLDNQNAANINIKKAGAEYGDEYYKQTIEQLVNCFSNSCKVQQRFSKGIVSLEVTAEISVPWVGDENSPIIKVAQQSFAPARSWTDYIFYEQLLKNLLGEALHKVKTRIGTSEECIMFIFPSTKRAEHVIRQFELQYLSEDYGTSENLVPNRIPDIPQPTVENLSQICELVGLSAFKGDDDLVASDSPKRESEKFGPTALSHSLWDKLENWMTGVIWCICICFAAYIAYNAYTSEPLCHEFEEYIADTNQCVVPCLVGENRAQCYTRTEKLRVHKQQND